MNYQIIGLSSRNKALLLGLILAATAFSTACIDDNDDGRIVIIVSILPQKEFVERVGGDRVRVTAMVGEGQDPHDYEPRPSQMKDVARADIYFMVGSGMEFEQVWMDTIREQNDDMEIVDGSKGITLIPFGAGHSVEEEAVELFMDGPFENVDAGRNESHAPFIESGERCYIINLTEDDGNNSGFLKFIPGKEGEHVIFLEHGDTEVNFTVKDEEGNGIEPEEQREDGNETRGSGEEQEGGGEEKEADGENEGGEQNEGVEGNPFARYASFDFSEENYTFNFSSSNEKSCKLVVLAMQDGSHENEGNHQHGNLDPHVWNSPRNARIMVGNLLEALKNVDPENADYYSQNANDYIAELDAIDQEFRSGLEPYRGRKFLVYHPAFGYLAYNYNLEMVIIEEEGKEPTPAGVQAIIDQAKEENIGTVFVHPQFDRSNAEVIADEINGNVVVIDPLGKDYLENMMEVKEKLIEGFGAG